MIVNLSLDRMRTVDQMRPSVEGADLAEIIHLDRERAYTLIAAALERGGGGPLPTPREG